MIVPFPKFVASPTASKQIQRTQYLIQNSKFKLDIHETFVSGTRYPQFIIKIEIVSPSNSAVGTVQARYYYATNHPIFGYQLLKRSPEIEISKVTLKKEHHNQGLGTLLMDTLFGYLSERITPLNLETSADVLIDVSTAETEFYTRMGFTVINDPYKINGTGECSAVRLFMHYSSIRHKIPPNIIPDSESQPGFKT